MTSLSNNIYNYYLEHLESLPFDKQFHFASRYYLWSGNPGARSILDKLRSEFTANENPQAALSAVVERTKGVSSHGSKNAAALRAPYFEQYPKLKMYISLLFRVTFLQTIYGIDARQELLKIVTIDELTDYEQRLLKDDATLAILSTHAVNFTYLLRKVLMHDQAAPDADRFIEIGRTMYDTTSHMHLQLFIYLYTHCILGESIFYSRKPVNQIEQYTTMLSELEKCISNQFENINLDNKFEYLVCCKILGVTSPLEPRIFDEAARSISEQGAYLIDRHNNHPQRDNITLERSEHRNILFILANEPFNPPAAAV